MHFAVDKISSIKWKVIKFHIIFWLALIIYEIPLAGFISGRWGNPWDYVLHYLLYISLFYFHSRIALERYQKGIFINICWIIFEFITCFGINLLIVLSLNYLEVDTVITSFSFLFFLAAAYRFTFILLISTAYWYMLNRVRNLEKIHQQEALLFNTKIRNKQLQTAIMEERLSKHKASIVPHFLFNTLHVLYHQIRKEKPQEAEHLLSLSEMMQYNLSPLDQQYKIPLSHELAYVKNYVALRQLERPYALKLNSYVPEEVADELQIIPLIFATLIENVFHHGDLFNPLNPALFSIRLHGNKLRIRIRNKLKGTSTRKNGIGMDNTLTRLAHFYPQQHKYISYTRRQQYIQKLYIKL